MLVSKKEPKTEGPIISAKFHLLKQKKQKKEYKRKNKLIEQISVPVQKVSFHVSSGISPEELKKIAPLAKEIHMYTKSKEHLIPIRNEQIFEEDKIPKKDSQSKQNNLTEFHQEQKVFKDLLSTEKNLLNNNNLNINNFKKDEISDKPSELKNQIVSKSINVIYQEPEKRYQINKEYLRDIYDILKSKYGNKITYETLDSEINFLFRSALSQGTSFPEGSFIKFRDFIKRKLDNETLFDLFKNYYIQKEEPKSNLFELYNINIIPYTILIGREREFFLKKDELSAEFIGIMLGDGHLNENGIQVKVTLNAVDEPQLVLYVENLMMQLFDHHHIYINYEKGFPLTKKGVHLTLSSKSIHHSLVDLGLVPGDKIKNKATAPIWVFDNNLFIIKCLKGLFDTDGSISIYKPNKSLLITFGSASKILTEVFKKLCNSLEIDTQKITISKNTVNKKILLHI